MPTVLLVEDEGTIAAPLTRHLEREAFAVVHAATLGAARSHLRDTQPDVVLLDLMLPDGDGRDLCREIRERSSVPIIMLTARAEEEDRIFGLTLGADDYVPKPFSANELVARIRALLRRAQTTAGVVNAPVEPLRIGEVTLDPNTHAVTVRGEVVGLSPREFDLLALLMRNAGRVLRREEIMDAVWDPNWFGSTKTLDVHVSWLRKKLEVDPTSPRHVLTVRGVGFRFATDEELRA